MCQENSICIDLAWILQVPEVLGEFWRGSSREWSPPPAVRRMAFIASVAELTKTASPHCLMPEMKYLERDDLGLYGWCGRGRGRGCGTASCLRVDRAEVKYWDESYWVPRCFVLQEHCFSTKILPQYQIVSTSRTVPRATLLKTVQNGFTQNNISTLIWPGMSGGMAPHNLRRSILKHS